MIFVPRANLTFDFRCKKPFGFHMHKVSERRETEVF